jgi:hypothetical protein
LNQDIIESGNVNRYQQIYTIAKPYGITQTVEHETGTIIVKIIMIILKLKEKNLKQTLRNLKMEKLQENITYLLICASMHHTPLKQGY